MSSTIHSLPTADEYAAAARRRSLRFGAAGMLLAALVAGSFVAIDNPLLPLALLLCVLVPVLLWRFPDFSLYAVFGAVCLFELALTNNPDSLTDRVPFFWNVNTIFQQYAHSNVKAVPLNLLEVFVLTAGVCSVFRTVYTRSTNLRGGALLWPIVIYVGFVGMGWLNGMATGGDFKISLQEVRSQFYFLLAYLMAVNMIRSPRQMNSLLWIMALGIGLKGILYTFRRYVTLHGMPLPDQGVGSHEEAFFFDAFSVLLAVLLLCRVQKRLCGVMLCLLPFVTLGNLACNRRAATAAMIIVVPVLALAAYRALPDRRRAIVAVCLSFTVLFAVYFAAFQNSSSMIGQPARAIKSQFQPDARDASSNAYRDAENADLMATVKAAPIQGWGYGKKMIHAVPIADISADYEWWDIMTHNQILWVWMRVGTFGFFAFWMMIAAILVFACRQLRAGNLSPEGKAVAMFALLTVGMLMIFGLLDLQLSNFRDMLFAGFWTGALAVLPAFARSEAAAAPASSIQTPSGKMFGLSRGYFPPASPSVPPPVAAAPPPAAAPSGQSRLVGRNIAATLATQLISWGLTFAVTLVLPRYLGAAGLGKLTFAASFVGVFAAFVSLGTSTALVKMIARSRERLGELLPAALLLRVPLALLLIGVASLAVWALGYPALTRLLVLLAALGMLGSTLNDALGAALQGLENIPRQSVGFLVDRFLSSALTISLVFCHAPIWAIASVGLGTSLAALLVNLSAFRGLLPDLRRPSRETTLGLARAGLPFLGWGLFLTLYGQTDPIVLSLVCGDVTVGWYAAAFRLVGTTLFLPTAITTALLPTLSRLYSENPAQFQSLARRTLTLVMLCSLPIALVLILLPGQLIALLHYPASFKSSIPVLRVGGVGVLLWFAANVLGTTVVASDGQSKMFRVSVVATVIGIPACVLGAYLGQKGWHNGAVGAMVSDVLLETYLVGAYLRMVPKGTFDMSSLGLLGRSLAAAVPVGAFLWLLSQQGMGLWIVAPSLVIYAGLCWVLRCLSPADMAMARQILTRKAGA